MAATQPLPLIRSQWPPGRVDPIRLNLFFDLIFSISRSQSFEALGNLLGIHLRFVIDIDGFDLILGDPGNLLLKAAYSSSKEMPRGAIVDLENDGASLTETLQVCALGRGPQEAGNMLCYPLSSSKDVLGMLILKRVYLFDHSERRFAEAIGGFIAQMLVKFAMTGELVHLKDLLNKSK